MSNSILTLIVDVLKADETLTTRKQKLQQAIKDFAYAHKLGIENKDLAKMVWREMMKTDLNSEVLANYSMTRVLSLENCIKALEVDKLNDDALCKVLSNKKFKANDDKNSLSSDVEKTAKFLQKLYFRLNTAIRDIRKETAKQNDTDGGDAKTATTSKKATATTLEKICKKLVELDKNELSTLIAMAQKVRSEKIAKESV